jgi:phage protein D
MSLQDSRKTHIKLIYEGADISRDIAPFLLSFDYDDKASGEADDIQITLEDKEGLWRDPWYPSKGDRIEATIVTQNWSSPGESESLYCGSFEVDEIEITEPPMTVSVKAVSAPRSTNMRDEEKTKNWEDYKLSGIAQDIAANAGMTLEYLTDIDPQYDTRNQVEVPDLKFLLGLCTDEGLALKVTDTKIVIYGEREYEGRPAVSTIRRGDTRIISVNIKSKLAGTFKGAKAKYNDSLKDVTHISLIDDDDEAPENGQTLQINQRVRSEAEAETLAKNKLHQANKSEVTGSFTLAGDKGIVGGVNVDISGYGKFDGTYFVESAKHSYSGSGYTTSINVREGGPSKAKKKKNRKASAENVKHISLLQ